MRLTLTRKVLLLVALPLVFQVVFLSLLVTTQLSHSDASDQFVRSRDVLAASSLILQSLIDSETGIRGYAVTDDPEFTEPYDSSREQLAGRLERLNDLLKGDLVLEERGRKIEANANTAMNWLEKTEKLIRDRKWKPETMRIRRDVASQRIRDGKKNMDALREEIGALQRVEIQRAKDSSEHTERLEFWIRVIWISGTVVMLLATGFLTAFFWRGIGKRFAVLSTNTRKLAEGTELAEPVQGNDEIGELDAAFHTMATQINDAMANLRRSHDETRELYNQAPCGYHSIDSNGNIIAINDTELRWLGYTREEVIGRKYSDFMSEKSRKEFADFYPRFMKVGSVNSIDYDFVRKDGSILPVFVTASSVFDESGRYICSRSTVFDLTERQRAERAIQLYADIVASIPIGLMIFRLTDPDDPWSMSLVSANPEASSLLGIPMNEAVGQRIGEVFPTTTDDRVHRYARVAATPGAEEISEVFYGDDRVAQQWWHTVHFHLPDSCVGVAFQNISAQKQNESEIRHLNEELESRVRERTAQLEEANRDLTQKNQENEMFVYSVSHDLRSPLVNLQGFSKELEKGCGALSSVMNAEACPASLRDQARLVLDGKMAKSLGFIQAAVMRLSTIIDALLRLSRAGRVEYRLQLVDLNQVISRIFAALQVTIAEKKVTIHFGDVPPAWGDPSSLEQVFANLIGNALNYLDPKRAGVIEVGFRGRSEGFNTYFVRDNGLGIAPVHHHKIFQVFQRVHLSAAKGEGMGLAIVARVVERHRGRVWVESEEGRGSTFLVSLPDVKSGES